MSAVLPWRLAARVPAALDATPAEAVPPLIARNLGFRYGSRAPVFEGVNLEIRPREIVCLLGGSGCGKSTLLRVVSGLARPTQGEVSLLGSGAARPHPRAALVFQQPSLLPWLSVARNVGFGLAFKHQPVLDRHTREARVAEALEAVGLGGKGGLYPAQLSGGMAQRVALARALARQPELLLADEPFAALDAITRAGMQDLLIELMQRRRTAALLVTHDLDEAVRIADRILLMAGSDERPGRIVRTWQVARHAAAKSALRDEILAALHEAPHTPATLAAA